MGNISYCTLVRDTLGQIFFQFDQKWQIKKHENQFFVHKMVSFNQN